MGAEGAARGRTAAHHRVFQNADLTLLDGVAKSRLPAPPESFFTTAIMSDLNLDQLQELVNVIKADQAEQKAEKARNAWTKYVSLSMIFIAVAAAAASQKSAGFASTTMKQLNEATFFEGAAS